MARRRYLSTIAGVDRGPQRDIRSRLSLVAEDGNPHELAQALAAIQGKRVRVQITLEQPELFAATGQHSAGDLEQSAADVEPMQDQ